MLTESSGDFLGPHFDSGKLLKCSIYLFPETTLSTLRATGRRTASNSISKISQSGQLACIIFTSALLAERHIISRRIITSIPRCRARSLGTQCLGPETLPLDALHALLTRTSNLILLTPPTSTNGPTTIRGHRESDVLCQLNLGPTLVPAIII